MKRKTTSPWRTHITVGSGATAALGASAAWTAMAFLVPHAGLVFSELAVIIGVWGLFIRAMARRRSVVA